MVYMNFCDSWGKNQQDFSNLSITKRLATTDEQIFYRLMYIMEDKNRTLHITSGYDHEMEK